VKITTIMNMIILIIIMLLTY